MQLVSRLSLRNIPYISKKTSLSSSLLCLKSPLIFPTGISMTRKWLSGPFSVHWFSSVQSLSCIQLFATPWIAGRQASLSIANSRWLITVRWALLFASDYHAMLWGLQLLRSAVGSEPPAPGRVSVWWLKGWTEGRWMDGWMDKGINCKVHWKLENEKVKKKELAFWREF